MTTHPQHARRKDRRRSRALLRVGLTVSAAGAAAASAGSAAAAAEPADKAPTALGQLDTGVPGGPVATAGQVMEHGVGGAVNPVADLKLNPLAGTGSDPLDNAVRTQIADFRPVSTEAVTGPLASGASLDELPAVRSLDETLPG